MVDMMEYYQQISELKKAVRERELHRLELEKQALLNAQKRERRHEDFKDKIREIQRELNQRELEAAKNFQTLLARVDSIRKEHQLLAAHTEQLRQRKLQYEMSIKSADPLLHSAVHQDSSGIFNTSGEALWKGGPQVTSTPASKSQPLWATPPSQPQLLTQTVTPQPLLSPITSYSAAPISYRLTQPMERYMTRGDVNVMAQKQPPYNVCMTNPMMSSNNQNQEPVTQGGMISHMQSSADKIPSNYSQPSHVYPLTSPMTSLSNNSLLQGQIPNNELASQIHASSAKISGAYSQPSNVGYKSLVDIYKTEGVYQNQTDIQPATRSRIEHGRSSSLDGSQIHNSDKPFTDRLTSSNPVHLQSISNPSEAETNYLTHLQATLQQQPQATHQLQPQSTLQPQPQSIPQIQQPSTFPTQLQSTLQPKPPSFPSQLQSALSAQQQSTFQPQPQSNIYSQPQSVTEPQKYAGTNPPHPNEYITPMHNNHLVTSVNGTPIHTPDKNISMNGGARKESGIMSHHLRNLPYDSLTHDPLQPSSFNTTLHPELGMQNNNITHPTTSGIYISQPDPYINRDLPEKDTGGLQAPSLQDSIKTEKLPSSSSDQEITKNFAMLNTDDKPREMFSPRKYDERAQNDNEAKICLNSDTPSLKPDITLDNTSLADRKSYPIEADHDKTESSILNHTDNTVNIKQDNDSKPHQSLLTDNRNSPHESKTFETITSNATHDSLKDNGVTSLTHPKEETAQKILKSPDSLSSSSKETTSSSPMKTGSPTRPTSALPSKVPTQSAADSDTNFFDQNIHVTDSAAYKSLVSGDRKGSVGMESESDEAEGQLSALIAKPQTTLPRPVFKPFASSIPSLRPAPADTDTDSVDSVEAAIQAAMKKKDQAASSEPSNQVQQPQSPLKEEGKSEPSTEQKGIIKPGTDRVLSSNKPTAALPINLDSDAESYEVSVGADASDEDDFDFYDKF